MSQKVRLDALEAQKLGPEGEQHSQKNLRAAVDRLVSEAKEALPAGVPPDSPYRRMSKDEVIAEAARLDLRIGGMVTEDELRLVAEHARQKLTRVGAPLPSAPPPPVPMQVAPPVKIRGVKPSPTNTWRVDYVGDKPPTVSVGSGHVTQLHRGATIDLNHYGQALVQSMVDQGVKLIPIEEPEAE